MKDLVIRLLFVIGFVAALVFFASMLSGCSAALVERLSTDIYDGDAKEPYVEEHPLGEPSATGVLKRLMIHNPLPFPIKVKITCASIYNDDPVETVPARRTRFLMVNGTSTWRQSCFLTDYRVIYPVVK